MGRSHTLSDWELAELVAERDSAQYTWEQIGFHFGIHKKTAQREYERGRQALRERCETCCSFRCIPTHCCAKGNELGTLCRTYKLQPSLGGTE